MIAQGNILGRRILFLGCHLDDIEYGCAGLIQVLKQDKKNKIRMDILSDHNENADNEVQLIRDRKEMESAMKILKCDSSEYHIGSLAGQRFDSNQQRIREYLINIKDKFVPDSVFFPAMGDIHQDHKTLSEEAFRIFRGGNCFGYEVIRSTHEFVPTFFCELTEKEIETKCNAIMEYHSQLTQSSAYYFNKNLIRSIAVYRGGFSEMPMAEAFEIYMYRMR